MIGVWAAIQILVVALAAATGGAAMSRVIHGAAALRRSAHLRGAGRDSLGMVIDTRIPSHLFRPVVAFETQDGEPVVTVVPKTIARVSATPAFTRDAVVPIRYDPADPHYAEIARGHGSGSDGLAYVASGGAALVVAIVAVVATVSALPR